MSIELSEKFGLECETRFNKGKKIIVIKHNSFTTFYNLINPYMLEEMKYKLPKSS